MTAPDKQPQHIGKGMIVAAWILLLVLLTWFFNDRLEQQRNPNREIYTSQAADGQVEVRLQRNRSGHYVASGEINGHPVEFLLDTGATDVSIPADLADRLGLKRGRQSTYQTANGLVTAWQTVADEISLGPLRLGPVTASINPQFRGDAVLLGMSFLKQLDFSQQGNTLTLKYAH
jgi:aspartyl protease family protein